MLKAIIFDLDDTLLDTQNQLTWPLLTKVHQFLVNEGYQVPFESMIAFRKTHNVTKPKRDFFKRYGRRLTRDPEEAKKIALAMTNYYYSFRSPFGITLTKSLIQNLSEWSAKYPLFLVTAGKSSRQQEKIDELKIKYFFKHVFIADKAKNVSKSDCFLQIVQSQKYLPQDILSVGNRVDLELRESKLLGMKTCLVKTGEYKDLEPRDQLEIPDYTIENLRELNQIIRDLEGETK